MKVIRDLEISAPEFFGVVFAELTAEIRKASGDPGASPALVTGFTQVYRPEDPALKVVFEIVEYREDTFYKAAQTSAGGVTAISYEVAPREGGITVTYTYEADPPQKKGPFSWFSELLFLGRMTDKLYDIQRTVINEKEGFTERKSASPLLPSIRRSK